MTAISAPVALDPLPTATTAEGAALPSFPKRTLCVGILVPLALLGWLIWSITGAERAYQVSLNRSSQVTRLVSTLAHLDEVLSMSTVVAAWAGNDAWEGRYREHLSRFQATITETLELAPETARSQIEDLAAAIAHRPVDIEIQVFERARAGRFEEARQLLDQPDYRRLKDIGRSSLHSFRDALTRAMERNDAEVRDDMARKELFAGVGLVLALVIWLELLRRVLRWRDQLVRACDTRLIEAENHLVRYIHDFSRSMAAMTESLTLSARQLRSNCQHILDGNPAATPVVPTTGPSAPANAPSGRAGRRGHLHLIHAEKQPSL